MKRIYIAGPMTGLPEYNFPAFHAATAELRAAGYEVENPAAMTPLAALTPLQSWLAILAFLAVFAVFVVALWRTDRGWYCQAQHPHPTRLDADLCDARRYEADRLRRESDAYADAAREGLAASTWPTYPRTNAHTERNPQ